MSPSDESNPLYIASDFVPRTSNEAATLSLTLSNYGTSFACFDPLEPETESFDKSRDRKVKKAPSHSAHPPPIFPKLRFMQEYEKGMSTFLMHSTPTIRSIACYRRSSEFTIIDLSVNGHDC
jgi:hypothetical protein